MVYYSVGSVFSCFIIIADKAATYSCISTAAAIVAIIEKIRVKVKTIAINIAMVVVIVANS